MKLIFCLVCGDIVKLHHKERTCECGRSKGKYLNNLHAEISGECIALGFSNPSFYEAVRNQPDSGEGELFTAFVIPKDCPTVHRK